MYTYIYILSLKADSKMTHGSNFMSDLNGQMIRYMNFGV